MQPSTVRRALVGIVASALAVTLSACSQEEAPTFLNVPDDVATIQEAADRIAEGGLILIEPGVYEEAVILSTNDVTIRGVDRNETIIDGGGIRPYGITTTADGVRIQNLTARNTTFYGVLVTGLFDDEGPTAHGLDGYDLLDPESFPPVERFEIDHVTAHNNGLYGIYAFDSIHGVIKNSYASGSADSGFYVGQCRECDIVVIDNVAERNAVGFENANASDSLVIAGNRFNNNRVGMTLLSNYQEAFTPQRANVVVGNAISDNNEADSPAQADGGFGTGIGISGGHDNVLERNRVEGNSRAGLLLANTEDIPVLGTRMTDSLLGGNGVDVANISADRSPAKIGRASCRERV